MPARRVPHGTRWRNPFRRLADCDKLNDNRSAAGSRAPPRPSSIGANPVAPSVCNGVAILRHPGYNFGGLERAGVAVRAVSAARPNAQTNGAKIMVAYDLSHLTGRDDQLVNGEIQDDEALFLYAIIRGMRLKRVLEVGGLNGYSATNFVKAVEEDGMVYTIDINEISRVAPNHKTILKDARLIVAEDVDYFAARSCLL